MDEKGKKAKGGMKIIAGENYRTVFVDGFLLTKSDGLID